MEAVLRDVRYAVRALTRQRAFTLTVLATLALGIGANTAMFSIVYGMLLRPLPYPDSEAIVRVGEWQQDRSPSTLYVSNATLPLLQEEAESFEQLAAYTPSAVVWRSPAGAVTLPGARVSPSLFPLLRATPHLGRLFAAEEARSGADQVVLLSHRAWTNRFGSAPDIVGSVLELDDELHTVVGVLAEGFYFPSPAAEVWTPFAIPRFAPPGVTSGPGIFMMSLTALGRLRPGVTAEQAAAEVGAIMQRGGDARFIRNSRQRGRVDAGVIPLREEMVAEYRPALLALTAALVLVLLIACVNVAGLLLARGVARQRAQAICAALGAGRGRLVRQILTESVLLGLGGGAIGLAAAAVVLRVVPALVPGDIARLDEVGIDAVVLVFTLGLSVLVGLAFGVVPSVQWSGLDLVRTLNEGSTQSTGGFRLLRSNRTRAVLATAQVALTLVLLVGAGLLLRSFVGLITIDRGYDPANVIAARTQHPDNNLMARLVAEAAADSRTRENLDVVYDEVTAANRRFRAAVLDGTDRLAGLPGVAAAGLSYGLPLAASPGGVGAEALRMPVHVAGRAATSQQTETPRAWFRMVSPGYFDVMRLRLQSGRFYTRRDGAGSPRVVVVNETFAREFFGNEPAVGQRVRLGGRRGGDDQPWEVIGVVADVRYRGLSVTGSRAEAFVSVQQAEAAPRELGVSTPFVAVRTIGDPLAVIPFLREAVIEAHPRAWIDDVRTMDARLSAAVEQPRFYAAFVGFFAALALFLAAFGLYGLLSYTVAQRRREIGVRMALGAQRGDILTLVVGQGAALIAVGAVAGLLAAAASSRILESFLYGVATADRLTFVAAPLLLVAVALVACWLPARRATRIHPMDALRIE